MSFLDDSKNLDENKLTKEIVYSQLDSSNLFPVDFDHVWTWLGYSRKDSGLKAFLSSGFIENQDYIIEGSQISTERWKTENHNDFSLQERAVLNRKLRKYLLTIDCFKAFCMIAGTVKGKEVRLWYLQIEKEWNQLKKKQKQIKGEPTKNQLIERCLEIQKIALDESSKIFDHLVGMPAEEESEVKYLPAPVKKKINQFKSIPTLEEYQQKTGNVVLHQAYKAVGIQKKKLYEILIKEGFVYQSSSKSYILCEDIIDDENFISQYICYKSHNFIKNFVTPKGVKLLKEIVNKY